MANRYWVGNGGSWQSTSHWSATSGGASGASVPTDTDNVFFDANSFSSSGQTITLSDAALAQNLDFTGVTNNPTFDLSGWGAEIYGNLLKFVSGMSIIDSIGGAEFYTIPSNTSPVLITMAGKTLPAFVSLGGTISLQDAFAATGDVQWIQNDTGTSFATNNHNMTVGGLYMDTRKPVTLGTSVITSSGDLDLDYPSSGVTSLSALNATLIMTGVGKYFYPGSDQIIGELRIEQNTSVYYTNATINTLKLTGGRTYTAYRQGASRDTMKIGTNIIGVSAGPGSLVTLRSNNTGVQRKISKLTGVIGVDYFDLKDSQALGGATFYAGSNSTDSGNNTGWIFTDPIYEIEAAFEGTSDGEATAEGVYYVAADITGSSDMSAVGRAIIEAREIERKEFTYRVYDSDGTYLGDLNDVTSQFSYAQQVNTAGSAIEIELARTADTRIISDLPLATEDGFDLTTESDIILTSYSESNQPYGEGTLIDFNNRVDIYAFFGYPDVLQAQNEVTIDDQDNSAIDVTVGSPNGRRMFTGYITDFTAQYGAQNSTKVSLASFGTQLANYIIEEDGSTRVPYYSQDPSDIARDLVDKASAAGLEVSYSMGSIQNSNTVATYIYKLNTFLEGIQKVVQLAPADWYWYYDQSNNKLWLRGRPTRPAHTFVLGKHVRELELKKHTDQLVNTIYFTGGDTNEDENIEEMLFKKYVDSASVAEYGQKLLVMSDERVTLESTADILANSELSQNAQPRYTTDLVIIDKVYPIEEIRLGDLVAFRNFDNFIDTIQLQVLGITYAGDYVKLQLGSLLPTITKRVMDIKRNLEAMQAQTLPDAPVEV